MSHADAEHLTRADGAVVVPPSVAGDVLRALVRDLTARVRADGGEITPGVRRLLYALHAAAQQTELECEKNTAPHSADTGTAPHTPGTVAVAEAAALMGCSPRHVRALIGAGRLPARRVGARVWGIDRDALDHFRHRTGDTTP